ncbi:MAG: HTH domain-containing protein [Clostridia bacterium]|nr:HTH domain-containing protein [Clostridia bacterium]
MNDSFYARDLRAYNSIKRGTCSMENELLHGRQRQLLSLLKAQQQVVTSKDIAAQLEVSDRTVRNDVRILNNVLERYGARVETTRGKGLILRMPEQISPKLSDLAHTPDTLQTREDRANVLLVRLLLSDAGFQLGDLEDRMFISRTTLENDIRFLRKLVTMRRPHLYLSRRENRISIETSEWNRRLVLTKIFSESWDYHSREGVFLDGTPLDPDTFQSILELTKNVMRGSDVKMDDYDLIALAFSIAVAEFRIRTGHPLDMPLGVTTDALKVAPLSNALMDAIEGRVNTVFDVNERNGVMLSLSFRQNPPQAPKHLGDILHLLDQNALRTTDLFLEKLREEYGVDFSGDKQLYSDLALHIFRLEKRLRYSYERRNPLLPTIKSRFIYFFELAMVIRECFQAVYGMNFSEDEWGYFADLLITSSYRTAKERFPSGVPVAFVSHLGRSDRDMLAGQIRSIYGDTIDLRGPYSIYEKAQIMAAQPEIILSTVRLETVRSELVDIPHITIPASFSDDAFLQLNVLLRQCRERLFFQRLPNPPGDYFEKGLFFTDVDFVSEQEAITFLAHRIAELGYATAECVGRALEREEWSSTAVENGVAIPRVRALGPCRTVIAFAQLRKPIFWGNQKVNTVFLPSVAEGDLPLFGTLLTYLVNHLCSREMRKRVAQVKTFEDLKELL